MREVRQLNKYALLDFLNGVESEQLQKTVKLQSEHLSGVLDARSKGIAKVTGDRGLTAEGRAERIKGIDKVTAGEIEKAATLRFGDSYHLPGLRDEIQKKQTALAHRLDFKPAEGGGLQRIVPATERPFAAEREREIRDRLLGLDDIKRLQVMLKAATDNDVETLRAARHGPAAFPMLDSERTKQVEERHIMQHHAVEAKALGDLENLKSMMTYNLNVARRVLGDQAKAPVAA